MSLQFTWDENKAYSNFRKHRISFKEACTVFYNPLACIFDDEDHSEEEHREIIIGHSAMDHFMKKTIKSPKSRKNGGGELRAEYQFDYKKARPNRFVRHAGKAPLIVALDPDVAKVFSTSESVNHALRTILEAFPK